MSVCRSDLDFRMLTTVRPRTLREFRTCIECEHDFERARSMERAQFETQKFCSYRCYWRWRKKHGRWAWTRTSDEIGLDELIAQQSAEMEWGMRNYPGSDVPLFGEIEAREFDERPDEAGRNSGRVKQRAERMRMQRLRDLDEGSA